MGIRNLILIFTAVLVTSLNHGRTTTVSSDLDHEEQHDILPSSNKESQPSPEAHFISCSEYLVFLKAAASERNPHHLYSDELTNQITRTSDGTHFEYELVAQVDADLPLAGLSEEQAMRYCNWIENGTLIDDRALAATESGSYDLQQDDSWKVDTEARFRLVKDEVGNFAIVEREESRPLMMGQSSGKPKKEEHQTTKKTTEQNRRSEESGRQALNQTNQLREPSQGVFEKQAPESKTIEQFQELLKKISEEILRLEEEMQFRPIPDSLSKENPTGQIVATEPLLVLNSVVVELLKDRVISPNAKEIAFDEIKKPIEESFVLAKLKTLEKVGKLLYQEAQKERERAERQLARWRPWSGERDLAETFFSQLAERQRVERELAERQLAERQRAEWELAERQLAEWQLARWWPWSGERDLAETFFIQLAERQLAEWQLAERQLAERSQLARWRPLSRERGLAETFFRQLAERQRVERQLAERQLAERRQRAQWWPWSGERDLAETFFRQLAERQRAERERERAERQLAERELAERELAERELAERELAERWREKIVALYTIYDFIINGNVETLPQLSQHQIEIYNSIIVKANSTQVEETIKKIKPLLERANEACKKVKSIIKPIIEKGTTEELQLDSFQQVQMALDEVTNHLNKISTEEKIYATWYRQYGRPIATSFYHDLQVARLQGELQMQEMKRDLESFKEPLYPIVEKLKTSAEQLLESTKQAENETIAVYDNALRTLDSEAGELWNKAVAKTKEIVASLDDALKVLDQGLNLVPANREDLKIWWNDQIEKVKNEINKNSALAAWYVAKQAESEVKVAYDKAWSTADAEAGTLFDEAIAKREEAVTSWGKALEAFSQGLAAVPEHRDDLKTWWNGKIEKIKKEILQAAEKTFLTEKEETNLHNFQNQSHTAAQVAMDAYRSALNNSDATLSDWLEVGNKATATLQAWTAVKKHCEEEKAAPGEKKACWREPIEIAEQEIKNWERAVEQLNPNSDKQHNDYPTLEELQKFPFAEVYRDFGTQDRDAHSKKEVKILHTMFKYPYIRVEKLLSGNKVESASYLIANQLELMEEKLGELKRFSEDKKSEKLVDFISKSEDGVSGLLQFNLDKLYELDKTEKFDNMNFPPSPIERLLNGYELNYTPNYLLSSEMNQVGGSTSNEKKKLISSTVEDLSKEIPSGSQKNNFFRHLTLQKSSNATTTINSAVTKIPRTDSSPSEENTTQSILSQGDNNHRNLTGIAPVQGVDKMTEPSSTEPKDYIECIHAREAWELLKNPAKKNSIVIAFIDSGIDHTHPNLKDHMWSEQYTQLGRWGRLRNIVTSFDPLDIFPEKQIHGWNFANSLNGDRNTMDTHGHGTFCTGISSKVLGHQEKEMFSNNVKFMACKAYNDGHTDEFTFNNCLKWAGEHGANIINFSNGYYPFGHHNASTEKGRVIGYLDQQIKGLSNSKPEKIPAFNTFKDLVDKIPTESFSGLINLGKNPPEHNIRVIEEVRKLYETKVAPHLNIPEVFKHIIKEKISFVTSAGNEGKNNDKIEHLPSNFSRKCRNILTVAATKWNKLSQLNELWEDSNHGSNVHIGAYGEDIVSILPEEVNKKMVGKNEFDNYKRVKSVNGIPQFSASGTSAAAPQAAAAVAMMMQVLEKDKWEPNDLIQHLIETSADKNYYNDACKYTDEHGNSQSKFGDNFGLLDIYNALFKLLNNQANSSEGSTDGERNGSPNSDTSSVGEKQNHENGFAR